MNVKLNKIIYTHLFEKGLNEGKLSRDDIMKELPAIWKKIKEAEFLDSLRKGSPF